MGMTVVPFHRRSPEAEADVRFRMEEHGGLCAHTSDLTVQETEAPEGAGLGQSVGPRG